MKDFAERYGGYEGLITEEQLAKLHNTSVLIAGCGAGSPVASHLARLGVGTGESAKIILADPDIVERRNLNRPVYTETDAEEKTPKTEALRKHIQEINRGCHISKIDKGIQTDNADMLVESADVVIEMVDIQHPNISLRIHQAARRHSKPLITGMDLSDSVIVGCFDYRNCQQMSLERYLGIPEGIDPDILLSVNPLSISAQMIIGPQPNELKNDQEIRNFYGDNYFEKNSSQLFSTLPEEFVPVIANLLEGKLSHIPQTDIAAAQLGAVQAEILKKALLGSPVKTVPDFVKINLTELVKK